MKLPAPVPEIPVASIDRAVSYYVDSLGFTINWGNEEGGIAGISSGDCRLFLTSHSFRGSPQPPAPVVIWLNLDSSEEVDSLFAEWKATHAIIVSEPEDKPWNLHEFTVADVDGNQIRVFYDFS